MPSRPQRVRSRLRSCLRSESQLSEITRFHLLVDADASKHFLCKLAFLGEGAPPKPRETICMKCDLTVTFHTNGVSIPKVFTPMSVTIFLRRWSAVVGALRPGIVWVQQISANSLTFVISIVLYTEIFCRTSRCVGLLPGVFPASAQVSCSLTKLPWAPRALLIAISKFFFSSSTSLDEPCENK